MDGANTNWLGTTSSSRNAVLCSKVSKHGEPYFFSWYASLKLPRTNLFWMCTGCLPCFTETKSIFPSMILLISSDSYKLQTRSAVFWGSGWPSLGLGVARKPFQAIYLDEPNSLWIYLTGQLFGRIVRICTFSLLLVVEWNLSFSCLIISPSSSLSSDDSSSSITPSMAVVICFDYSGLNNSNWLCLHFNTKGE